MQNNYCLFCFGETNDSMVCPHCGHRADEPQTNLLYLPRGTILNKTYIIGCCLGQGGFGITYLAFDRVLHVKKAIKEYFPSGIAARNGLNVTATTQENYDSFLKGVKSFYTEARAVAMFGAHPNIIGINSFFQANGTAYFVMEYADGISLEQYLQNNNGKIPFADACGMLLPIADALSAIHAAGLLHRDVKPDNIYINKNGQPKLLDFGAVSPESIGNTLSRVAVLTPGYSPPEQYSTVSPQGTYTDVYAFAATLYRTVTGRIPPCSTDRMIEDDLTPPQKTGAVLSVSACSALEHALIPAYAERTQTIESFVNDLTKINNAQAKPGKKILIPFVIIICFLLVYFLFISTPQMNLENVITAVSGISIVQTRDDPTKSYSIQGKTPDEEDPTVILSSPTHTPSATITPTVTASPTAIPTRTNTPEPTLGVGSQKVRSIDDMTMVYVPAGEFIMGYIDPNLNPQGDAPNHSLYLDAFWIDQTEVTNAQYQKCESSGNCSPPHFSFSSTAPIYYNADEFSQYPVIWVDWGQADTYCRWVEGQLPTEAQWEKAARGLDGRYYPWSNNMLPGDNITKGNFNNTDTLRVGSFRTGASPYGALDMIGNVWEWVADWYASDYYLNSAEKNPTGPGNTGYKVMRGVSWDYPNDSIFLRLPSRTFRTPDTSGGNIGFRCVMQN